MAGQQIDIVANIIAKVDGAEAGIKKLQNSLSKLKLPDGLDNSFKKSFANLDVIFARYKSQVEKGFNTKADVTNFAKTGKALDAELDRISKHFTELTGKPVDFKVNSTEITKTEQELEKLIAQRNELAKNSIKFEITGTKEGYKDIESLLTKLKEVAGNTKTGQYAGDALNFLKQGDLQSALALLDKMSVSCKRLNQEKQDLFSATGLDMSTAIKKIVEELTGAEGKFGNVNTEVAKFEQILADLRTGQIKDAGELAKRLADDMLNVSTAAKQANGAMQDTAQSTFNMTQQLNQLQQSTQYFFSLRNMINLFKRGIKEAVQTVKELDKAMTETAVVVPEWNVGDMWAKLPEYTKNANALGASVVDMYKASTLYYQQGLRGNEVLEIASETMKMARIGGLEAADATDKMTAALRGFNMEISETSAQHINDVYSNLAANTASNTKELGTAMQRTASIAASAGMSFEGTAAFLAQAIETTREPAENLGTAMKTIVARFTELKKNPLEITEVDGEEVSYNKVDTALQSIGVSLKDANGQFRDLDQVFLEISQRWDSLTQTQQRYIATTAAGSRQQSRFIAMMSNYERTVQLMDYANNAEGASAKQFNKTLESLEAKINKFQNAWKQFLMGIMNDSWTKRIVDAGTKALNIVNNLINILSFGGKSKGIKSFLSLFTAFQGLRLAGRGINGLIGGLAGSLTSNGGGFIKGFKTGIVGQGKTEINQATNRIVQAINGLIPHIDGKTITSASQGPGQYNQARKELVDSLGGHLGQIGKEKGTYTVGNILNTIKKNQLDNQQQKQFFQASPGLKKNLTKSLIKLYKEVGTDKKTIQALTSGFKKGDLGLEEALLGNDKLSTTVGKAYEELINKGQEDAAQALRSRHAGELYASGIKQGLEGDVLKKYVEDNLNNKRILNNKGQAFLQNPQVLTNSEKFANVAGQIGAGFMAAGSAVQMFGAQVSQVNPILGQAISNFGGLLTAAGSFANIIPSIIAGGPVAWGIAAAVTAIGGLAIGLKAHSEKIKKQGQELVDNYNNITNELNNSISNIEGYKTELTRLSTGVDVNGFNINLDDSEYQRYKELVDDLVQQNPDIVKGWNSEGQAIIDVNSALKDTIKLKQQALQKEEENYLLDSTGQQLINARNATKEYKQATSSKTNNKLIRDANSIVTSIISSGLSDEAKAAGFDLEKLRQGDLQAINFLRNHYGLLENIYKEGGQEISDTLSDSINNLNTDVDAYEESISAVVDYLQKYASNEKLFADLPVELTNAFNEGIKSIAGKDLEVGEMKKAVNYLGLELRNAFNEAEPLINQADEALNQYARDLDDVAYNDKAEDIAKQLRSLKEEAEAVGQVEVAEWYENQASQIENALTNSVESISSYIDTLSDDIANAKTNFDALADGVDDYYTLADKAYGLVETALETKNTEGEGSKTFWNTYRGLASEESFNEHDIDKAVANMKQFKEYFTEGAEGSAAFARKLINWQDKEVDFGDGVKRTVSDFFELAEDGTMKVGDAFTELTDEQYAQLAAAFDLSSDGFTAILNKLRQFGDLEFTDYRGVRKAMALDDRTVKTKTKVSAEGEEEQVNRLYYGQSMLEAEIADKSETERNDIIHNLEVRGAVQLPSNANDLIKKEEGETNSLLKQFINDTKGNNNQLENVISALYQTGEYDKDGLETVYNAIKEQGLLSEATDKDKSFEDIFDHVEDSFADKISTETNDHLSNISSTVDTIAGIIAAGKVKEGFLPDVARQSNNLYNDLVGQKGIADTWAQLFSQGKDANGKAITDDTTYSALEKKLNEWATINNNYLNDLRQGREAAAASGASTEALDAFDEEIANAEHNAELIELYSQNAAANYDRISQGSAYAAESVASQLKQISLQNLSSEQQKSEITGVLQNFATELQGLNFSPEQIQSIFKENFGIELELEGGEFATDIGQQIQDKINSQQFDLNAVLNISSVNMAVAAKGKNNTPSAIHRVGTMARGSKRGYIINGEPTLTGELGPELVWEPRQNRAYMVGEHGPQFASLSKDAVVWNAKQTKKIQKNSKGVGLFGTGARGIHSFGTMAGGNTSGGGRTTLPGTFSIDASVNVQEIIFPTEQPTIPVKAEVKNKNSVGDIEASALVTKVEKSGQVVGEPISVQATATTTKVENKTKNEKTSAGTQTMNVTANTSAAQSKINQLINLFNKTYTLKYKASGPSSIKVPISANFTGSWKKTVTINKSGAKGINNYISHRVNPIFNSAAGGYGQLGPKGKGGLTLTGEKGFEIAWLPSENRSMILGTTGPQMLNLPSDAVVYTHEQSKKILKQKSILAGSHANTANGSNIFKFLNNTSTTSGSSRSSSRSSSSGSSGSSSSSSSSNTTINHFSIEEVVRFNLDKKIEAMTSKIKKLTEEIDKNLKRIGTTALDITDSTQEQIKNLKSIKAFNDSLIASYQKDLNAIDLSKYMMKVSYTDDNGESQDYTFDAQWYTYLSDGQYYINDSYIRQLGSPALQKAVYDAVKGLIDPLVSGLQKARDAADDAQKQIEDLAEKFADTFYGWENELTEIYNLTQRIENETSFTDRFASQIELELSRLGVGLGEVVDETKDATVKAISNISAVLNRNNQTIREQIEHQKQLMEARKRELDNALSAQDELDKIDAYKNSEAYASASDEQREAVIKKLTDKYDVATNALAYIKNVTRELDGSVTYDIDWEGFEEAIRQNPLNEETYKAIKEYLDSLNDTTTEYNGSIKDTTDLLKQTYDDLKKYQDTIVDFEGALLKGVEEQIKNDTENAKKLSDSISNALKDLLDEVKRKLDERRKQEDNAKTERDIAQKQQRLAALRANTSGGNQVEIAQLEKEIADAQQSYGRTLEDQLLDKLQQQGDEAKLQRERQIQLAETSNEINAANNKELVNSWLRDPQTYKEQIKAAWLEAQGYKEKGIAEQDALLNQWDTEWTNLLTAIEQTGFGESTDNIEANTYTIVKLLKEITGVVDDVTERNTETLKDLTQDVEGAKKAYSKGISIEDLEKAGFKFDAKTLKSGGYTPSDLRRAGFGVGDLVSAGITDVKTLKDAGFNDATAIKTALGETNAKGISDYKSAGFTAKDLKGLFGDTELIELFDAKALKDAQFTASQLKGKFNILQLKDAGYTLPQLKDAFKASEFGAGGISYADARTVFTAAELKNVAQYAKQAAAELQPKVSQGRDLAYGSQGSDVKLLQQTLNKLGIRDNSGNSLDVDGDFGQHTREAVINFQKKYRNKASKTLSADGVVGYYTKEAFKALGYKTGGLADYTGPAWLDGTPSKPELVLNATDTKNFLALRDVLSSAMKSTSSVANAYGGNATYEININVDKLTSDYDVDRVAERVKKIIVKDSSYRNVTQVRNFR